MGGKSSPPPPPDYSGVAAASEKQAELSYKLALKQFHWAQQVYKDNKGLTDQVGGLLVKQMQTQMDNAQTDRARYQQIFQPLEEDLANEAKSYGTPERKDLEMGRAESNVAQQFQSARQSAQQNLEAYGINPSDTRYAALDIGMRANQAAATAAAGNQASENVDNTRRALRSEAINVGRGYPGQIAGSYAGSMNAGNSAVGNAQQGFATGAQAMGTPTQWMGAGNQAIQNWGNTLNMGYQNQLGYYNAQQQASSGWGSLLGGIAGIIPMFFEEGGAVPMQASPSKGAVTDDVPAAVSPGEFIVPKEAVEWFGQKHFYDLVEKSKTQKQQAVQTGAIPQGVTPQGATRAVG